jgi:hypothetical protein
MRLYRKPTETKESEIIHSYKSGVQLNDYQDSIYNRHWVIEMPSKIDERVRESFLTIRALSIVRAEKMSGRATVVWAVMKLEDVGQPGPHKVLYTQLTMNIETQVPNKKTDIRTQTELEAILIDP